MRVWHADRSISDAVAQLYLQWIARFRRYCDERDLVEANELTHEGTKRFQAWYVSSHKISAIPIGLASSSMHALRRVHEVMGTPMPPWRTPASRRPLSSAVLRDYAVHLTRHRGNPDATVHKKLDHVAKLFEHLAASGKSWRQMRLPDIDEFLIQCAYGLSAPTEF